MRFVPFPCCFGGGGGGGYVCESLGVCGEEIGWYSYSDGLGVAATFHGFIFFE